MMASRSPSRGSRPLQRGKGKKSPMMQYLIAAGGLVVLIVVVVLLVGSGAKRPAAAARVRKAVGSATSGTASKSRSTKVERREEDRKERKRRIRAERRRLRDAARAARRSSRRGGSRSVTRVKSGSPNSLRAIVTDDKTGTRYALVGERRYKAGDDVGGRKIASVTNDGVTVTYGTTSYSVKVGQPVY